VSSATHIPVVTATQTLSAYTVATFSSTIQAAVSIFVFLHESTVLYCSMFSHHLSTASFAVHWHPDNQHRKVVWPSASGHSSQQHQTWFCCDGHHSSLSHGRHKQCSSIHTGHGEQQCINHFWFICSFCQHEQHCPKHD